MPLDATYDQLMRLLSARGLEWIRQRVTDLPDPLDLDHHAVAALALAGRLAPVLSGLRGHPSPLEEIVRRRLAAPLAIAGATASLDGDPRPHLAGLVLAGRSVAAGHAVWQLALAGLAEDEATAPADRLAAGCRLDGALRDRAEAIITRPLPGEAVTRGQIDEFARLLMQLYEFGAARPHFSRPHVYGEAFGKLLHLADWARRKGAIAAMAQIAFCLRLIDPDHDIADLVAEIIAHQRPDGSFPAEAGHSTRDQDLDSGIHPTLMALLALNIATWRRWRGPVPAREEAGRPLGASRDLFAAVMAPQFEAWANNGPASLRLRLAAAMCRATSENWFLRYGLGRLAPSRAQLLDLSRGLFGDAYAARHARTTLDLAPHWPHDLEGEACGPALRWLRGAPVDLGRATTLAEANRDHAPMTRVEARREARDALRALDRCDDMGAEEALARLERLCLLARQFEGEAALAAAA